MEKVNKYSPMALIMLESGKMELFQEQPQLILMV